jgi:hypothetical protein
LLERTGEIHESILQKSFNVTVKIPNVIGKNALRDWENLPVKWEKFFQRICSFFLRYFNISLKG